MIMLFMKVNRALLSSILSGGLVVVMPFLASCAKPAVEEVEVVKTDKLVARVASVHAEEGYALIQRYGRLNLGDDAILYTLSVDGVTSSLKVTGEKLGQFVAVDIVSGELNIGDAVYLRDLSEEGDLKSKDIITNEES